MSVSIFKIAGPVALAGVLALGVTAASAQGHGGKGGPGSGGAVHAGARAGGPGARIGGNMSGPRFSAGANVARGNFNAGRANFNSGPQPARRAGGPNVAFNGPHHGGNWGGDWRWRHHHRGWRGPGFAFGFGYGYPYYSSYAYDDAPYYYADETVGAAVEDDSAIAYCQQRYRSYDVASQTYLGYDGERHPCP